MVERAHVTNAGDANDFKLLLSRVLLQGFATGENRRYHTFPGSWCRFCRTGKILQEVQERRESLRGAVLLQFDSGVYLELLTSLETEEFIKSLKRFIARRGRPSKVYSDNGKTFVAAAKWLNKVRKDEKFNDLLSEQSITWHFNLSRAPWWGGQVERLIAFFQL